MLNIVNCSAVFPCQKATFANKNPTTTKAPPTPPKARAAKKEETNPTKGRAKKRSIPAEGARSKKETIPPKAEIIYKIYRFRERSEQENPRRRRAQQKIYKINKISAASGKEPSRRPRSKKESIPPKAEIIYKIYRFRERSEQENPRRRRAKQNQQDVVSPGRRKNACKAKAKQAIIYKIPGASATPR
ncbi:MAG: hypothetical protein K5864_07310 [Bacteroidales bacterium]|nr:hypothetical protein [Bacteroidales bacterium]